MAETRLTAARLAEIRGEAEYACVVVDSDELLSLLAQLDQVRAERDRLADFINQDDEEDAIADALHETCMALAKVTTERDQARALLRDVAAHLKPCPAPNIADGYDLCTCQSGEVWPCTETKLAWRASGIDAESEMRKVRDEVRAIFAAREAADERP